MDDSLAREGARGRSLRSPDNVVMMHPRRRECAHVSGRLTMDIAVRCDTAFRAALPGDHGMMEHVTFPPPARIAIGLLIGAVMACGRIGFDSSRRGANYRSRSGRT